LAEHGVQNVCDYIEWAYYSNIELNDINMQVI